MNPTASFCVDIDDVRDAAARIRSNTIRTPVVTAPLIDELVGASLFFKCENLQHVGAFKARGALNAVLLLTDEQAEAGVVTHSSGNHAAALARAASIRRITAHIVMPHNSAHVKVEAVRSYGVDPVFCEPDAKSRQQTADRVMAESGAMFIHPYDNAQIIAGQGTTALELLEQTQNLDAIVVPVGGGGLLSGVLIAAKAVNPRIKIYAAEPAWADDAHRSLQSGQIESPHRYDTIADGLRTPLGRLTFPVIREFVQEVLLVSEQSIRNATRRLIRDARIVVEPSGAVPLAAVTEHADLFRGSRVGLVISGGNVDTKLLIDLLQE